MTTFTEISNRLSWGTKTTVPLTPLRKEVYIGDRKEYCYEKKKNMKIVGRYVGIRAVKSKRTKVL